VEAVRGRRLPAVPKGLPVFIALQPGDVRPDREGIRGLRTISDREHDVIDGLRVAHPGEILLAAARDLGHRLGIDRAA
jgi:hypothetical protein